MQLFALVLFFVLSGLGSSDDCAILGNLINVQKHFSALLNEMINMDFSAISI